MSAITVKFPAPLPAEIPCPICRFEEGKRGKGCIACEFEGKINLTVDAKIPRLYGLVPKVETTEVIETENGQFEIVQVSSLGGAVWIANSLDELAAPKYLFSHQDLEIFKGGFEVE